MPGWYNEIVNQYQYPRNVGVLIGAGLAFAGSRTLVCAHPWMHNSVLFINGGFGISCLSRWFLAPSRELVINFFTRTSFK